MTHTATPWRVMTGHPSRGLFVVGPPDEHGYEPQVCEVDRAENVEANAAFIVRAVNSHSALLAALRTVEWAAEGYAAEGLHPACPACRAWQSRGHTPDCQLAKALRDAEGETE